MAGAHMEGVYFFEVWDDQTSSAKLKSLAMEVTRLTNRVGTLMPHLFAINRYVTINKIPLSHHQFPLNPMNNAMIQPIVNLMN